jgi:hypothetical protein
VDQETDKIKHHIETEREELGKDLHEIEDRVKRVTDLKGWFDRNPAATIGAAVAGGFILSMIFGKSRSDEAASEVYEVKTPTSRSFSRESSKQTSTSSEMHQIGSTLDKTFAALIGVASRKFRNYVADAVPGFREQYELEQRRERPNVQHITTNVSGEEAIG